MRTRDFSAKDMLCELHWLPVRKRMHYKLLLLTYKTNGSAPEYLVNQLKDYCPTRASVLWNVLPCQIKKDGTIDCFKSMIKKQSLYGINYVTMNYCFVHYIILHI